MNNKFSKLFIIGTFVLLYSTTSIISTVHTIDFFMLSNPHWLAVSLAVAFEIGAAASLASIVTMDKMNKVIVWSLFFILTAMACMANAFYAYTHLHDYNGWVELFGLVDEDVITQKRVLSLISGAILPLVSLGFIKSLVDYLKPSDEPVNEPVNDEILNYDAGNLIPQPPTPNAYLTKSETVPESSVIDFKDTDELVNQINNVVAEEPVEEIIKSEIQAPSILDKFRVFKKDEN